MRLTLSACAETLEAEQLGGDARFERISTDTRDLQVGDVYIAISGQRFDGHDFIEQAIAAGASALITARAVPADIPQLVVDDTRRALGRLAKLWRSQLSPTVLALTGSNGKTTTKEMLASILSQVGQCFASPGNLNNDIGVPKSLCLLEPQHRYAVMELGANRSGEIAYLSKLVMPHVAMITNASRAHIEGFGSTTGVIEAKGEIYSALGEGGVAIINRDDDGFDYWRSLAGGSKVLSFGFHPESLVRGEIISPNQLRVEFGSERCDITLSLLGKHNLNNALAAAAAALALQVPFSAIQAGLQQVQPVAGRLSYQTLKGGVTLVDDSYNANPASVKAAIDVLAGFAGQEQWLMLGDMAELGRDAASMHAECGQYAVQAGITRLWSVGELSRQTSEAFGEGAQHFDSIQALVDAFAAQKTQNCAILLKGSRSAAMERAVVAIAQSLGTEESRP